MRLLVAALIVAATSISFDIHPASSQTPGAVQPLSVWRPDAADGLEHLQSGLTCPPTLGAYRRITARVFDGFGLDVGCSYKLGDDLITAYLTRGDGRPLSDALEQAKRELLQMGAQRHPLLISETRIAEDGLDWTVVIYGEDNGIHTGIWIADLNGWILEYRATYAADSEPRMLADLSLVTGHVRATAGKRLALCAKAPPPDRSGKQVTRKEDQQQAALMAGILGGAALAAMPAFKQGRDSPTTWCVESSRRVGETDMLTWRGVDPDGGDARVDKVSGMTMDAPPVLQATTDLGSQLEMLGGKTEKPLRWTATYQQGDQTLIFGVFDGRPSAAALSDLFVKVISGKAESLGAYSAKGKDITISVPSKE